MGQITQLGYPVALGRSKARVVVLAGAMIRTDSSYVLYALLQCKKFGVGSSQPGGSWEGLSLLILEPRPSIIQVRGRYRAFPNAVVGVTSWGMCPIHQCYGCIMVWAKLSIPLQVILTEG